MKSEKVKATKREEINAATPRMAKPKVIKDSAKHLPPPPKVETPDEKVRNGLFKARGLTAELQGSTLRPEKCPISNENASLADLRTSRQIPLHTTSEIGEMCTFSHTKILNSLLEAVLFFDSQNT